jgi:hypothetical protein
MSKHDLQARPISCRRRHEIGYAEVGVMPMTRVWVLVSAARLVLMSA